MTVVMVLVVVVLVVVLVVVVDIRVLGDSIDSDVTVARGTRQFNRRGDAIWQYEYWQIQPDEQ
jgi:hypothetical protein